MTVILLSLAFKRDARALSLGSHHPTQESRVPSLDEAERVGQLLLKVYGPASQSLMSTGITLGLSETQILIQKFGEGPGNLHSNNVK